jgi:hypothetical protein
MHFLHSLTYTQRAHTQPYKLSAEHIHQCHCGEGVTVKLKEYECVEVEHHKDVGRTIEEWQRKGWRLHTYQTAGMGGGPMVYKVNHYLLFEKGE